MSPRIRAAASPAALARFALAVAATVASLWLAEALVRALVDPLPARRRAAVEAGLAWDARPRLRVVLDERAAGRDAAPAVYPSQWLDRGSRGAVGEGRLDALPDPLPLAGLSLRRTVLCNESGQYAIYASDEHGFRNPPGSHARVEVDAVLLGDSFVHGACVERDVGTLLRARGLRVLNLGQSGAGPLLELAIWAEFGVTAKPRALVWTYFEDNDLSDLHREWGHPRLRRWLDGGFSAGMADRQAAVDALVSQTVETSLTRARERWSPTAGSPSALKRVCGLLALKRLRALAAAAVERLRAAGPTPGHSDVGRLERVLAAAVRRGGADLTRRIFVYLPSYHRYGGGGRPDSGRHLREAVLSAAQRQGFEVLDLSAVLDADPDPLALYPMRLRGHFCQAGHDLWAGLLARRLSGGVGH